MEAAITAPFSGRVVRILFTGSRPVLAGDLLVVMEKE